ncbi:MAG: hypothetical protein IJ071_11385 [Ruminococcus sp.]|nr:hypothetical protein [Ruminococcus sp.]
MGNKKTIQRKSSKKRGKPMLRFNFWVLFIIFVLSFAACFILYMVAANLNPNFFKDEFEASVSQEDTSLPDQQEQEPTQAQEAPQEDQPVITNPVPQSAAVDAGYFDSCCMITDSTLLRMGALGKIPQANVLGNDQLNALNCNSTRVESSYGTVTPYEVIKLKKPDQVYIMLGSDIGTSSADEMVASYATLVNNIHASLPELKIYVMQLPPVIYDNETVTNDMINDYNAKLLDMCNKAGVYCIDTNTALKGESGTLSEEYWDYDTLSLSQAAYEQICGYILTHTS